MLFFVKVGRSVTEGGVCERGVGGGSRGGCRSVWVSGRRMSGFARQKSCRKDVVGRRWVSPRVVGCSGGGGWRAD